MPRVVFYELPPMPYVSGIAHLVSRLVHEQPLAVIVGTDEEARELSEALWALPPSLLVPHGIVGLDADEELDPVIIAVGASVPSRTVVVRTVNAPPGPVEGEMVVETVPRDEALRDVSRRRFKAYKSQGAQPEFVPWETWGRGEVDRT